uniref:Fam-a protein n=1 Tax=Strongyloides venezuelensis TaxID=75913 RepID=A0A0K0FJD0_STRVS
MKYLVFSIILSTVFVLTINGVDIPNEAKLNKYTGDKSFPIAIAKNATKKYNKIKNEPFKFVEILKVKQATIINNKHFVVSFLAKKCKKNTTQVGKNDDKEITKSRGNACISKILYAKYINGTYGEKLTVGDFIIKHTTPESDKKQSEKLKNDKKKDTKKKDTLSVLDKKFLNTSENIFCKNHCYFIILTEASTIQKSYLETKYVSVKKKTQQENMLGSIGKRRKVKIKLASKLQNDETANNLIVATYNCRLFPKEEEQKLFYQMNNQNRFDYINRNKK